MSTETQDANVEQQVREITLWSTKNGRKAKLSTNAKTWGDLKNEIAKHTDFDIKGLLATENQKRTDLANDLAILPETNFVIYFRAKETKSGGEMSYKELRAAIKGFIDNDGDPAKEHFNQGKNYTTKSTDELKALHASYKPKAAGTEEAPAETVADNGISEVVESVAASKVTITNQDRIGIIRENLEAIKDSCNDGDISDRVELASDEVDGLEAALIDGSYADLVSGEAPATAPASTTKAAPAPVKEEPKESEEDRIAREQREADAAEDARLEAEFREMSGGFKK